MEKEKTTEVQTCINTLDREMCFHLGPHLEVEKLLTQNTLKFSVYFLLIFTLTLFP